MALIVPRFIAIDSSLLGSWANDAFSSDSKLRTSASNVQQFLVDANWMPIICLHHFMELARHSDLEVGKRRMEFLKSFSQIAWIGRSYDPLMLGSVVDVFEAEVAAIVDSPGVNFAGMRTLVRAQLFQYGPLTKIKVLSDWEWLHSTLKAMEGHEREVASILHVHNSIHDDMKIASLRNMRLNPSALKQPSQIEIEQLAKDLGNRGDARLTNPSQAAQTLHDKSVSHINDALRLEGDAYDIFVRSHDVPQSDLSDETTLKQFKQLARRRKLGRVACDQLGIDLDQVWPNLRDAKIPSEIIQENIRKARKTTPRASGSDIGDDYLACLSPYVDCITVDKRTHEFMIQGARRNPTFQEMIGLFIKARSYAELPTALASAMNN